VSFLSLNPRNPRFFFRAWPLQPMDLTEKFEVQPALKRGHQPGLQISNDVDMRFLNDADV